jgi:cytidine deaminase
METSYILRISGNQFDPCHQRCGFTNHRVNRLAFPYNLFAFSGCIVPTKQLSPHERDSLLSVARQALKRAYAPYSNFHVGAAVLTEQGEVFSGCNVENASYGLTICAERSAIFTAVQVAKAAKLAIRAVAVVNGNDVPCSPCGACRQVIFEFGENAIVIFKGQKDYLEMPIQDLLPESFRLF